MKVFASKYLECPSKGEINRATWLWTPPSNKVKEIYASGASTRTRTSTYAAEKDDRADSDRPNEGMLAS